jgi:class 3 adenylate cyclase
VVSSIRAQRRPAFRSSNGIPHRNQSRLGDCQSDDRHGNGVIVAERLQQLADKNSTLISDTVGDRVKGQVTVDVASLGNLPARNIVEPIRVYRVPIGLSDADAGGPNCRRCYEP